MKSIAFFALSMVATATAMAATPIGQVGSITVSGYSEQTARVNGGNLSNTAESRAYANQNLASNKGSVSIKGNSFQTANLDNAIVSNHAVAAGDTAVQNLASNVGNVSVAAVNGIDGWSTQTANVSGATLKNAADSSGGRCNSTDCADAALAYQNGASNMGEVNIKGNSTQSLDISGSSTSVINYAQGTKTVAIQNMSSNYGKVDILGGSKQTTSISNGAIVANLAHGNLAQAVQNIASNDSCEPPPVVCVGPACGPYALK